MATKNYNKISKKVKTVESDINEQEIEDVVEDVENTESESKKRCLVYNCGMLNLRSEPNMNSEIVSVMSKGAEVVVYSNENDWSFVCTCFGKEGYALSKFLKEI